MDFTQNQAQSTEPTTPKHNKQLKQLMAKVDTFQTDIQGLLSVQMEMSRRMALLEERNLYRHEMTFNSLKRIATDVHYLKQQVDAHDAVTHVNTVDTGLQSPVNSPVKSKPGTFEIKSPAAGAAGRRAAENRMNVERILQHHVNQMNEAKTMDELQTAGGLAVKYADQLFKNYL